ncbi:MAG: fumarate reductase subunit C [Rhodospirillales bacterium]|nr:fumarate reductase subunit C [Rhodospirillales bacterium]
MSRKPYRREMSKTSWFMTHQRFKTYMLHEISSLFVAIYALILIIGLFRLGEGWEAWDGFVDFLASPLGIILHVVIFVFSVIHTMAWFKAVPQAMRIQRGDHFVEDKVLVGGHYAVLAVVSLFVLILAGVA